MDEALAIDLGGLRVGGGCSLRYGFGIWAFGPVGLVVGPRVRVGFATYSDPMAGWSVLAGSAPEYHRWGNRLRT